MGWFLPGGIDPNHKQQTNPSRKLTVHLEIHIFTQIFLSILSRPFLRGAFPPPFN